MDQLHLQLHLQLQLHLRYFMKRGNTVAESGQHVQRKIQKNAKIN
jgi:hypothetical protein